MSKKSRYLTICTAVHNLGRSMREVCFEMVSTMSMEQPNSSVHLNHAYDKSISEEVKGIKNSLYSSEIFRRRKM